MGSTLLVGIVSGVAAVGIGVLAWRLAVAVWSTFAHESRVAGHYLVYDDHSCAIKVGEARVRQHGTRVYVVVDRNISRDGEYYDKPTTFQCYGRFQDGVLTALFSDPEASFRPGTICLHYDASESSLTGKAIYYRPEGGVAAFTLKFLRGIKRHTNL